MAIGEILSALCLHQSHLSLWECSHAWLESLVNIKGKKKISYSFCKIINPFVCIPFSDLEGVAFLALLILHVYWKGVMCFLITGFFLRINQIIYRELLVWCLAHYNNSKLTAIIVAMMPPPMSKQHKAFRMLWNCLTLSSLFWAVEKGKRLFFTIIELNSWINHLIQLCSFHRWENWGTEGIH